MKRPNKYLLMYLKWQRAWVEVAESLVCILTFTKISPTWSFKVMAWECDFLYGKLIDEESA